MHPLLSPDRGKRLKFFFNGRELAAYEHDTIASALVANRVHQFKRSLRYGRPRGFFCGIGKCSACLMRVDGIPNVRTCITPVREGMHVESQDALGRLPDTSQFSAISHQLHTELVVVGAGPAGLSAALTAAEHDVDIVLLDENPMLGGQLLKQTHKFFGARDTFASVRGTEIAKLLVESVEDAGIDLWPGTSAIGYYGPKANAHVIAAVKGTSLIVVTAKKLVIATGAQENHLVFPGNDLPGVVGAGGVQTLMNVYGVRPGDEALMIGSGNVGLIVSYQMIQAGIDVKAVIEALPEIGGYFVHAAKLRRLGVPILTSHTIKRVIGKNVVKGARLVALDEHWHEVKGSESDMDVDLICIATGLTPSSELLFQAGCEPAYIAELGGWVARHNESFETTVGGIYVVGDASGVEEASTAMLEGRLAASDIVLKLGKVSDKALEPLVAWTKAQLRTLRQGRFGERARCGKAKLFEMVK